MRFLTRRTNHRDDEWGGDYSLPAVLSYAVEVVRAVRQRVGTTLCVSIACRARLVENGGTFDERYSFESH